MTPLTPLELIVYAAERLGDLREKAVFIGGAVVGLLISEPGGMPARATNDVDVVMEIAARLDYYQVDQRLLALGFTNDIRGPLCRYLHGSVIVDVMPTHSDALGFANQWYPLVVDTAARHTLPNGLEINLVTAPCF